MICAMENKTAGKSGDWWWELGFLRRSIRKGFREQVFEQRPEVIREPAIYACVAGGSSSQAETNKGNGPEAGGAWHAGGTGGKPVWLERNELGERRKVRHVKCLSRA